MVGIGVCIRKEAASRWALAASNFSQGFYAPALVALPLNQRAAAIGPKA
jgi:hypothetical protein